MRKLNKFEKTYVSHAVIEDEDKDLDPEKKQ
jgi:Ca2+-binding EF-hand superfamily protein